jgi:hypothetical protein
MTKKFKKEPDKTTFSARVDQNGKQGVIAPLLRVNADICQGFSNFRVRSRFVDRAVHNFSVNVS